MIGIQTIDGTITGQIFDFGDMSKIVLNWKSNSSGTVNAFIPLEGFVNCVITCPHDPTALYDISLYNDSGADELLGLTQNRSASATETAWISFALAGQKVEYQYLNGIYRLNVANAGSGKYGTIVLEMLKSTCVLP